jgi:putative endopeptidase
MRSIVLTPLCLAWAFFAARVSAEAVALPNAASSQQRTPEKPISVLPYSPGLDVTSMDRTVHACADFYQFSCGGWLAHNPIPSDQASWSVYGKLYQQNQQLLWGILNGLALATNRTESQQKIGDYFAACMNDHLVEQLGARPLAPSIARIAGLKSKQDLPVLLAKLHLDNNDNGFLFTFESDPDLADSTQMIAFAAAGGLGMPDRDYYTDTDSHAVDIRRQYRAHLRRTFELLGDNTATAAKNSAAVMRIEEGLAKATLTLVAMRDVHNQFHKMDRSALQRLTPQFNWTQYLEASGLNQITILNVTEPAFYIALDRLLETTSLEDIKAYLRWHVAHGAAPFLSRAFADERFAFFDHTLRGVPAQKPRWKRCVRLVDQQLGDALGQEFVARTFGPDLKAATLKMSRQIEQVMREEIEQLAWLSSTTKHQALAKLDTIVNKIGYPDRWRDYSSIVISRDDFFGNAVRASQFETRRRLAQVGKPLDRSEWQMTAQTVDGYYDPQRNDINFPAGVLQPPLYDPSIDDAPSYGNTGSTIGHELTHGFDDLGRQFDAAGNLKDWWTAADAKEFENRTQCIVDQYAKYTVVDDVNINSRLTIGEDLADLGGLILAHIAWRVQTAGEDLKERDGLTPDQRFFVGFAQWTCQNDRPENQRLRAKTDYHSPARYRVNGVVVNMPEFQEAFACPVNAPMVKSVPCKVW